MLNRVLLMVVLTSLASCGSAIGGESTGGGGLSGGSGGGAATGGGSAAGGGSASGERYLIYGSVWGDASVDCPEGSHIFLDNKGVYTKLVNGSWSSTYNAQSAELKQQMQAENPGQDAYNLESSHVAFGATARFAAIIQYSRTITAWDCRPRVVSIGYGVTSDEALNNAIEKKNSNDGRNATHTVLRTESW